MKHTLGLAMIMKDEVSDLERILTAYRPYVSQIYVTVTDRPNFLTLQTRFHNDTVVQLSYFEWCDHFGKARLYNQSQIRTDYWIWIDTDDEIIGADRLVASVTYMEERKLDALLLPYHYLENSQGEVTSFQWRERIIRTSSPLAWLDVAVHETVDCSSSARCEFLEDVYIRHRKTQADLARTDQRNKALLEKDWQARHHGQTAIYLGRHYTLDGRVGAALEMFEYAAENGESADLRQQAWGYIADIYCAQKQYASALHATKQAIAIDPKSPDAWYQQVIIYMAQGQYQLAAKAADIALRKKTDRYRLRPVNPAKYTYIPQFLAARAYLYNAEIEKAYRLFKKVQKTAPHYITSLSSASLDWAEVFEEVKKQPAILQEMLPLSAKRWPDRSIVFYARAGMKTAWGPDTLDQGMGGSEEAIVYLSRELAKRDWQVTVFCDRGDTYGDKQGDNPPVVYRPWPEFNQNDTFDIFTSWRNPFQTYNIKARRVLVDLHDVTAAEQLMAVRPEVDTFLVKSRWHRSLYPEIPDKQFATVGNGIVHNQISHSRLKRPHSAGYFSSYDRGLETLLTLWPQIRAQVPDATLDIYYGWDLFDNMHANNPAQQQVKQKMLQQLQELASQGVREHGRVGHGQLARAMEQISIWLYPTEWPETFCITALKTAEAGMQQVCTDVGALRETAPDATIVDSQHIYTDEPAQQAFVKASVEALLHPQASHPPDKRYWSDVADKWDDILR